MLSPARRLAACSALVALSASTVACVVPSTRYDEARSALAVEQQANRDAGQRLYAAEIKVASLQAELDKRQKEIDARDARIAQGELDTSVAARKVEDESELVEQLRGELARVGDHLRAFADQKQELAQALDAAEARAKRLAEVEAEAAERATVVRDLALLLHDPLATGEVELAMVEGRPALRVPSSRMLDGDGNVQPEAKSLLAAVAKVTQLHKGANVVVAERGRADGETDEQSTLRLRKVTDALGAAGLSADRVTIDVAAPASDPAPTGATIEIAVTTASG